MNAIRCPLGLLAALVAAAGAGCAQLEPGDPVRTSIAIDFSALRTSADGQTTAATVLEVVRLTAETDAAPPRSFDLDAANQSLLTFDVTVPAGNVRFLAEAFSNSGALLYRGSTSEDIRSDGFIVAIDVQPVNAVLVVTPDTIDLRSVNLVEMTVRNAGTLPLSWGVTADCDNSGCVRVDPGAGQAAPATQRPVTVQGFSTSGQRILALRIASNVGTLTLPVIVAPQSPVR